MEQFTKAAGKKKYGNPDRLNPLQQSPLYLLTSGPAKQAWTFYSVFRGLAVELMPVCDSQAQIVDLLEGLQDKSLQAATTSLAKLQLFVQEHPLMFVLNPKVQIRFDEPFLLEAPHWWLDFDQLQAILAESLLCQADAR